MLFYDLLMAINIGGFVSYGIFIAIEGKGKKSNYIACCVVILLSFFLTFMYLDSIINNKVNKLKEELTTETTTTTTTETTTIPTTITDDDGNIYVLQTTSTAD